MATENVATKYIYLNASELAIAVGANPYQKIKDLIIKLWARYFPEDYYALLDEIKETNKVEIIQETEYQCLQRLAEKYIENKDKVDQVNKKIQECLKSGNTEDLQEQQKAILQEIAGTSADGAGVDEKGKRKMDVADQEQLEKTLVSMTNKSFGTRKEGDAIAQYEILTKKKVQRISKYFTQEIPTAHLKTPQSLGHISWKLGGKIDGMTEDGELIEVKNRVSRFFNTVRNYEKVQIQIYFRLLDLETGYLVESLVKQKGGIPEINIVEVKYEHDYWSDFLMPRIYQFIEFFQHILLDNEFKMRMLLLEDNKMEREIRQNLFPKK